jgi:hypothetical protein
LKFFVTNDRTYNGSFVPVYFYWLDCADNAISDWDGIDLYISGDVYNYNGMCNEGEIFNGFYSIGKLAEEDEHIYGAFWFCDTATQVPLDPCPEGWTPPCYKPRPLREIAFFNGGVDIADDNEIDARGDLNLNETPYEIADAVLYTNYFIYGMQVFNINLEGQIAASDVNNDGRVLTVGDLVYLIRVLTHDAVPFEKISPFAQEAEVVFNGNSLTIDAPMNIGAGLFVFDGEAEVTGLLDNMTVFSDIVDGQTKVLVYSLQTENIAAGTNEIFTVNGDVTLSEVEVSDYDGNLIDVSTVAKVVPKAYALYQNVPNPFNPITDIAFDMPEAGNYSIDIYNVAGQLVKSFSGYSDAGTVKVTWHADGVASGIYFYKATSNNFAATKKMVLMK